MRPPARVLLLSDSAGLAAVLGGLLRGEERLVRAGSLREAAEGGGLAGADAVVLDSHADGRLTALEQLRQAYDGPLVVLVERGLRGSDLPPDDNRTVLVRPFAAEDLGAVLGLPPADAGTPAAAAAAPLELAAAAPGGSRWRRARQRAGLLPTELLHAWRARRWVRMGGFWAVCLLAFVIAFVLAAQDDSLGGVVVTPLPTVAVSPAPPTTAATVRGTPAGPSGTQGAGGFRGASQSVPEPTTAADPATTSTRRPAPAGGATTRPATTRGATTTTDQATTTTEDQATTTDTTIAGP
jgi:hypothetical protein